MLRRLAPLVAVAMLAILPATAAAATSPNINPPTVSKLSKPVFTWAFGPAGEYVNSITVSKSPTLDANGALSTTGGTFIYPLKGLTSGASSRSLAAGTYYWNARWATADGTPYETAYTPVASFTITPFISGLRGSYTQYGSITAFSAKGSFVSNAAVATVTCSVFAGKTKISQQKRRLTFLSIAKRNNFYCSNLKVPERFDGQKLRLAVQVAGAGKVAKASKVFTAI